MSKARQLAQKPSQPTGRKNLIINGAMNVAQRSTSKTGVTSRGYHACDRWHLGPTSHGIYTISQSTDAPNGFGSSLKIDCTTADGSIDAGSSFMLEQRLEGQDLQHIGKGTSSAKKVTVSFYVKSNLTSTFICELFDLDNSRHINQTFSISTADTWERKEITFDIETSNTLDNDNSRSLDLRLFLAAGSNFTSGTLQTSWGASTTANRAVGITADIGSSTSNEFYITGVQMEVGEVVTEFEHRGYGEELLLCQRYFEGGSYDNRNTPESNAKAGNIFCSDSTENGNRAFPYMNADFKVTKRGIPTVTIEGSDGTDNRLSGYSNATNYTVTSVVGPTISYVCRYFQMSGSVPAQPVQGYYEADAEL
jgi:hypothetical protein